MSKDVDFEVGATVEFTGFTGGESDLPDHSELLEENCTYEIVEVDEGEADDETVYKVGVPNPDYNPKKRKTKNNQEFTSVEVFADEIAASGGGEDEPEERADSVPFADVKVGDNVTVIDDNGEEFTGEVIKKLKASMDVDDGDEEGAVRFKEKEIQHITVSGGDSEDEDEDEPEKEEKPEKTTKKKSVKKKAVKKSTKKAPAKSESKTKTPKGKKGKVDVDEKGIVFLARDEEDEDIVALIESAKTDEELCALAEEVAEETANSEYKLGGILYHMYREKAYKSLNDEYAGKKGFAIYTEKELGVNYRKAMYLVKIYAKWNKFDLLPSDLAEVGWTKALHMVDVMNGRNANKLVDIAKKSTVVSLKDTIKENYVTNPDEPPKEPIIRITFKFRLEESAGEATLKYFEQAKEQLGYTSDNEVFEHIIAEWATQNLNVKKSKKKSTRKKAA